MSHEDYKIDYWEETLSCAFDELGIYEVWKSIPEDKQRQLAECLITSAEHQSMAFGYADTRGAESEDQREIKRLKKELEISRRETEKAYDQFAENVATRRKTDISNVIIDRKTGDAEYSPQAR